MYKITILTIYLSGEIMDLLKIFAVLYLIKRYCEETGKSEIKGKTSLHKLLFLSKIEGWLEESIPYFEFRPYYYGPYSFELEDIIDIMLFYDLIVKEKTDYGYIYKLTDDGHKVVKKLEKHLNLENEYYVKVIKKAIDMTIKRYKNFSIKDIMDYVYEKYSDFAPEYYDCD